MCEISVIIPVYNTEAFVRRCVDSVLRQMYRDFEVILVDDGSSDGSLALCHDMAANDSRVVVLHQANSGASVARNKGLDAARGEWVMFVDSDDWIEPDMLETMMDVANGNQKVQVVQTRVPWDMKNQLGNRSYSGPEAVKCLLEGSWWGPFCKLIKRSALANVRFPERTISEDYLFNYRLFSQIDELYYLDECFYHREDRSGSLSKISLSERKFDELYNVKAVYDAVEKDYPQYKQLAESHLAGTCIKLLFATFAEGEELQYRGHLGEIISIINRHYTSFLRNPNIPRKQRILLAGCKSRGIARLTSWLYGKLST